MTFQVSNNAGAVQLPAPELLTAMTGSQVAIGTLLKSPCKIIFDNQSTSSVTITFSPQLALNQTWKTFSAGAGLVLDNDFEMFSEGTTIYGTGAATGNFSISYTYLKSS